MSSKSPQFLESYSMFKKPWHPATVPLLVLAFGLLSGCMTFGLLVLMWWWSFSQYNRLLDPARYGL